MMATIRVHFDGKVFVPDEPVDLPVGTRGEISARDVEAEAPVPSPQKKMALKDLADLLAEIPPNPDAPVDGAAQHDHYLYGLPKRS